MAETPIQNSDQFPAEPIPRRRVAAGQAIMVMGAVLILTLFLDADGLMRTAERQQPGFQRSLTVGFMRPVRAIADTLGLTAPRSFVARASGHTQSDDFTSTKGVKLASPTTLGSSANSVAATTTTTLPPYRTPTPADPLRVLVAGDSLSGYLGPSLDTALRGLPVKVTPDEHVGTGLARPDVVDWPKEVQSDMDTVRPDVVVFFIGGNDDQDLRTPDGWIPISKIDEWKAEYQRRVAQVMNIMAKPGVSVYWVLLPVMGKAHLNQYVPTINSLIQTEADARPSSVTTVDSGNALNGPNGQFVSYLPDASGKEVLVRAPDGVHPTPAGMDRIVALFAPDLIHTRHLQPPPPPPTTTLPKVAHPSPSTQSASTVQRAEK